MKWKYYIPHVWEEGHREPWGEIWLLPEDSRFAGKSVCLTIDALGDASNPAHGDERAEFQREALEKLGGKDYWIHEAEMIVRVRDLSKGEFLDWVRVWLKEIGAPQSELVPGERIDFSGSNPVATEIERILKANPSN